MSPLFRDVAPTSVRLDGPIRLPELPSARLLAIVAMAAVTVALLFAFTVRVPRSETVFGALTPVDGLVEVAAQQGGEVLELRKREGDQVDKGEVIAVMSLSPALAEGDAGGTVRASFAREFAAVGLEAQTRAQALRHEQAGLVAQQRSLRLELSETRNQLRISAEQLALTHNELTRSEDLASRGYLTRRDLDARRVAALSAEGRHSQVMNAVHALERQLSEIASRIAAIPIELAALEAQAQSRTAQLTQRATESAAHNGYLITAPVAGRLVSSPVTAGNTADAGQSVAVILRQDAVLEAELYLPARLVTRVGAGLQVRLKYEAYPFQTYGYARGRISSIARTATPAKELEGFGIAGPAYRVMVALEDQRLRSGRTSHPLMPDMRLTAEIEVDRRTVIERLLDPVRAR